MKTMIMDRLARCNSGMVVVLTAAFLNAVAAMAAETVSTNGWEAVWKGVEIESKDKDGNVVKKFGGVSAVSVDRTTGDVYAFALGSGLYKSIDQGRTFNLFYESKKGSAGAWNSIVIDPENGKRLLAMLQTETVLTLDGGKNWIPLKIRGSRVTVDWRDPEARTIVYKNMNGHGGFDLSLDQGKTWKTDFGWVFYGIWDAQSYVRQDAYTTNGGKTWTNYDKSITPAAEFPRVFKGAMYGLARGGLWITRDGGKTWDRRSMPEGMSVGLMFGKDENQMIAYNVNAGFFESRDGGNTWQNVTPPALLPRQWPRTHHICWSAAWDPVHDVFYFCVGEWSMTLFRFQRKTTR